MKFILLLPLVFIFVSCSSTKHQHQDQKRQVASVNEEKSSEINREVTTVCTFKNEKRTIHHVLYESKGCTVDYTKLGETSRVAIAKNTISYCDSTVTRIRGRLEKSGFNCSDS